MGPGASSMSSIGGITNQMEESKGLIGGGDIASAAGQTANALTGINGNSGSSSLMGNSSSPYSSSMYGGGGMYGGGMGMGGMGMGGGMYGRGGYGMGGMGMGGMGMGGMYGGGMNGQQNGSSLEKMSMYVY